MDKQALWSLHNTLEHALEFLRYFSDSPTELDDAVEKQIDVVETAISECKEVEDVKV